MKLIKIYLNQSELERFEMMLSKMNTVFSVEMVDGLFSSLICGPNAVMPSEYIPEIIGNYIFENDNEMHSFFELVFRHWNNIAENLSTAAAHGDAFHPVMKEYEQIGILGNEWAEGFIYGIKLRQDGWEHLMHDEDLVMLMTPILLLAFENKEFDDDCEFNVPEHIFENRNAILAGISICVIDIYRYFLNKRILSKPIRKKNKIGRNTPCPCGSGKKYKHCCASANHQYH